MNLNEIAENYRKFCTALGFSLGLEAGPEKMVFRVSGCPRYEGFIEARIDHETIEAMCQANIGANNTQLNRYNPEALVKIEVRSASEGPCVEEYHIP